MLQSGDSFFAPLPPHGLAHLFFVISDPRLDAHRILIVPLLTWDEYKENTCILNKGEHRFIKHQSYIDYGCAIVQSAAFIEKQIQTRKFRKHDSASKELLEKIREGAGKSN